MSSDEVLFRTANMGTERKNKKNNYHNPIM